MKKVASWNRPTNAAKKHYHGANSVLRSHHVRWTCPSALPRVPLQEVQNHTLPSRHVLYYCDFWFPLETVSSVNPRRYNIKHHQNIIKTSSLASNRTNFHSHLLLQWLPGAGVRSGGQIDGATSLIHNAKISVPSTAHQKPRNDFCCVKNVSIVFHYNDPLLLHIILYVFWNIYLHVA